MLNRTDIERKDVFISWTGADRELKNTVVSFLEANGISCLESDRSCSGDFRQWSREAVSSCNVFLLILTENTLKSTFVPIEVEELKRLDDLKNRVVPVCANMELYQKHSCGLNEFASAIAMNERSSTEDLLTHILIKTRSLLVNRLYSIYRERSNDSYLKLKLLFGSLKADTREYSYEQLYINRTLTELDDNQQAINTLDSSEELLEDGLHFIYGAAGSGKTQYISQIRACASDCHLVISLPCAKVSSSSDDIKELMFKEFVRISGGEAYYSRSNFESLLANKRLVLILDGMDEIATQTGRNSFSEKVESFYAARQKKTAIIFTSRNPENADELVLSGKTPRRFQLNALNDDDRDRFIYLLFGSAEKKNDFFISAKALDDEIKSNPLLLSQLAIVYDRTGETPKTVVGIYEAISEITLKRDFETELSSVPDRYREMLEFELPSILKAFSKQRYIFLSREKSKDAAGEEAPCAEQILTSVLSSKYGRESNERASFLVKYLQNRSILVDGEFYHKMFLEYFTAVAYFDQIFNAFYKIEDKDELRALFSHYSEPYWSSVITLFLVKADSLISKSMTEELYSMILEDNSICEYTLLFDTCRDLIRHKEEAQTVLVRDILRKSASNKYPPYGPLFWYVPEYGLYETAVLSLACEMSDMSPVDYAKALSLVRDVCAIFAKKYTVADVTDRISGKELFSENKKLHGTRRVLCEYFCIGSYTKKKSRGIYPRCFDIDETVSLHKNGYGLPTLMDTPFKDELGLFEHESLNLLCGEHIGFISFKNDLNKVRTSLSRPTRKVRGVAISPTKNKSLGYLPFNRTSTRVAYLPENVEDLEVGYDSFMPLDIKAVLYKNDPTKTRKIVYVLKNTAAFTVSDENILLYGAFRDYETPFEVFIEEGVRSIGDFAFDSSALKSIRLPKTLESIGFRAFEGCTLLSEISLPDSLISLDSYAFAGCEELTEIKLPEKLCLISDHLFLGCYKLSKISLPRGIKKIGSLAFSKCLSLAEIDLPDGLVSIEEGAFRDCQSLTRLRIPDPVTLIGRGAFAGCLSVEKAILPKDLTLIDASLFESCESLSEVRFPSELEMIMYDAFDGCRALSSLELPDTLITIGLSAFNLCDRLQSIRFPKSIRELDYLSFAHCRSLSEVSLPDTVVSIHQAFDYCACLDKITIYQNPDSIPSKDVLINVISSLCENTNVKTLFLPARHEDIIERLHVRSGVEFYCTETCTPFDAEENAARSEREPIIPEGTETIPDNYFRGSDIERITLPDSVTSIGNYAFADCKKLSSITLSKNITEIKTGAFEGCTSLTEIDLPDKIRYVSPQVFRNCSALESVGLKEGLEIIMISAFEDCTGLVNIKLPDSVRRIDFGAFNGCSGLEKIDLPASLETLEYNAFAGCRSLETVNFNSLLEQIDDLCFSGCEKLNRLKLPRSVKSIGTLSFAYCRSLSSIELPEGLEEIKPSAFESCTSLENINIPKSVTRIEESAFAACSSLKDIALPSDASLGSRIFQYCENLESATVGSLSWYLFEGCSRLKRFSVPDPFYHTPVPIGTFKDCTSLEEIEIPIGYSGIEESAFEGCTSLKRVVLPTEKRKKASSKDRFGFIVDSAFKGCSSLEQIEIPDTVTEIGSSAFEGCDKLDPEKLLGENFRSQTPDIFGI